MIKHPKHILILTLILLFTVSIPASAICIKSNTANLRRGSNIKTEKLWKVYKYMPFKLLKSKADWSQVQDLDGDTFWVNTPLTTQKYKCAVVKKDKTNLREGPSTKSSIVEGSPVDKYFSMKVLKTEGEWVHIQDASNYKAWVFRPLVWIQ